MPKVRFVVVLKSEANPRWAWIRDLEWDKWNMPEQAVSLNFNKNMSRASKVCVELNAAWRDFLSNPD